MSVAPQPSAVVKTSAPALLGWAYAAFAVVALVAALDWVGWAADIPVLTQLYPAWPSMAPWTALILTVLGGSILLQSGHPSQLRVRAGQALAVAAGCCAAVLFAQYVTGREFGVDQVWFGTTVRELQPTWPGRPSPQSAAALILLSIAVGLTRRQGRWAAVAWAVGWLGALAVPAVTILAYIFDAIALARFTRSTGMALMTAVCLLLLCAAAALVRPDRWPMTRLRTRPERGMPVRLGAIIAGFPVIVGLSRRAFAALGFNADTALTSSTILGTGVVGLVSYYLSRREWRQREIAQQQTARLAAELDSAAAYMSSIMPRGLSGKVDVSSRYLPSRQLGGDCFDYQWIDDDHLLVYLIDVSGHGIEPALLAVSVHNLLRSGSVPRESLLAPGDALTELNRLFQMDQQNDHFFTMWLGVYEASTRTLCYASAGAPPAFALNYGGGAGGGAFTATELPATSVPVGMFADTVFTSRSYHVPQECRILIYSDGASELPVADGLRSSIRGFNAVAANVGGSSDWSLDELIAQLRALTPAGYFEDDCSLIQLEFV